MERKWSRGMAKSKRKTAYEANKKAKVGADITCPICGTKFVKRQYSQAFCCGRCKDAFWNTKGDRHSVGYYERYDDKHPERKLRKALYSMPIVTASDDAEIEARIALATDPDFKRYVEDVDDISDIPCCNVDLATQYANYLGYE